MNHPKSEPIVRVTAGKVLGTRRKDIGCDPENESEILSKFTLHLSRL